jgi:CTP synthase
MVLKPIMKYVVVTGGVVSGLGKGITASSIGVLLKGFGCKVTCIKIDPYLNIDAGTMSPFEHGEVYVLDDGGEVDLDMGNYERFLNVALTRDHNITTGKIYKSVLDKERNGSYLGKTVQVVPHITDEVVEWIERVAQSELVFIDDWWHHHREMKEVADVCIIELGGTVGDIESGVYVEALRQLQAKVGAGNFVCVHVGLVPSVVRGGELKSKPTQQSINVLRSLGLSPNIVACRCNEMVSYDVRRKIAIGAGLDIDRVISIPDVQRGNLWNVPLTLVEQNVHEMVRNCLMLEDGRGFNLLRWRVSIAERWDDLMDIEDERLIIRIGIVGKYTHNSDAYLSITKGLQHACMNLGIKLIIKWIESTSLEVNEGQIDIKEILGDLDGVLVPGGFGQRGIDGMIRACEYCRLNGVPFFGICLGMQVAVIEYCRNVLGIHYATSQEFSDCDGDGDGQCENVVKRLKVDNEELGGTMHLGLHATVLKGGTHVSRAYDDFIIYERYRHRYGVYGDIVTLLENGGLVVSGFDDESGDNAIVVELCQEKHPFYVGCQFHPEYKTRPLKPSPLFLGFVEACWKNKPLQHQHA